MRWTYEFEFVIRGAGRSFSAGEDVATAEIDLEYWIAAKHKLECNLFRYEGRKSGITVDWSPLVKFYERNLAATKYLFRGGKEEIAHRFSKARFPSGPVKIPIKVSVTGGTKESSSNLGFYFVETLLYDIFIILNLAAPGSCSFYRSGLLRPGEREQGISLSTYLFESSYLDRKQKGWPAVSLISLDRVLMWFGSVRSGVFQVPSSAAERAVFALFYLAKDEVGPTSVIWIFYALEGLLQTRVGEGFSLLVKRLAVLLEMDAEAAKILKKEMRVLYDIRSALVHGGFEVSHPIGNEILDNRASDIFGNLLDRVTYGSGLIIAILQKMIQNDWVELQFDEILHGKPRIGQ